jgi:hypothetical protein
MTTQNKRHANYVKMAEFRAAAVAYINTIDKFTPGSEIIGSLSHVLSSMGVNEKQANVQLRGLAEAGLIEINKSGKNFSYKGNNGDIALAAKSGTMWAREAKAAFYHTQPEATVMAVQQSSVKPGKASAPTFTVDLVKSSGRVRVALGGVVIEIGVVDN